MADQSHSIPSSLTATHAEDVEGVARDLKKLLANTETDRLKGELREDIERLSAWTETYLDGLEAARKISENAGPALAEAQKELELAYQEYLRLEDEGGNVASPAQQRHTDDLSRALRRLHSLVPAVGQTFAGDKPDNAPDMVPPEQEPGVAPDVNPPLENPTTPPDVQPIIPPVMDPEM